MWDNAFGTLHKSDPTEEDCQQAQFAIDFAMNQMRKMKMSITPKLHGTEAHAISQMYRAPGGIVQIVEHWVEWYHQVGFKYDDNW